MTSRQQRRVGGGERAGEIRGVMTTHHPYCMGHRHNVFFFVVAVLVLVLAAMTPWFAVVMAAGSDNRQVPIQVYNDNAHSRIHLFWVQQQQQQHHTNQKKEIIIQSGPNDQGIMPQSSASIQTFPGHVFVAREMPLLLPQSSASPLSSAAAVSCPQAPQGKCRSATFTVPNASEEMRVRITFGASLETDENKNNNNNNNIVVWESLGVHMPITTSTSTGRAIASESDAFSSDPTTAAIVAGALAHMSARMTIQEMMDLCKTHVAKAAANATTSMSSRIDDDDDDDHDDSANDEAVTWLGACVQAGMAQRLESIQEEIAMQASIRTGIAATLENYTCLDGSIETSSDNVRIDLWIDPASITTTLMNTNATDPQQQQHPPPYPHYRAHHVVQVMHERPASRIHVIEGFIYADECQAMEEAAAATLHRATVADGKGGSRLSVNRKAMQAGIAVPWDQEHAGHAIARVSRRVYDYTNHVLGLNIQEHGQEDLMSIQYFGRGRDDEEPDRYTPHCDGDCTGLPHKFGQRMATMVLYCDIPEEGGHTNFRNAGVHIKPESGNGIFFSYINPETKMMDTGFTEHSGCPVFHGTKRIVTQWIRLGVDDENPWNSFNTLGVKKSDLIDYDEEEEEENE